VLRRKPLPAVAKPKSIKKQPPQLTTTARVRVMRQGIKETPPMVLAHTPDIQIGPQPAMTVLKRKALQPARPGTPAPEMPIDLRARFDEAIQRAQAKPSEASPPMTLHEIVQRVSQPPDTKSDSAPPPPQKPKPPQPFPAPQPKPEMPLVKKQPPVQDKVQRDIKSETPQTPTVSDTTPTPPPPQPRRNKIDAMVDLGGFDLADLAEQVLPYLKRLLAIEKERRSNW
jgi:hypothetical protein